MCADTDQLALGRLNNSPLSFVLCSASQVKKEKEYGVFFNFFSPCDLQHSALSSFGLNLYSVAADQAENLQAA